MTGQNDLLSTSEAAAIIGVSVSRIQRFCKDGLIQAAKIGGVYLITRAEAERFKSLKRPTGRPRKHLQK